MLCGASSGRASGLSALFGFFAGNQSNASRFDGCNKILGVVEESEKLQDAIPPIACVRCGHRFPHTGDVELLIQAHAKDCRADIGEQTDSGQEELTKQQEVAPGKERTVGKGVLLRPKVGSDGEIEWEMTNGNTSTCLPSPTKRPTKLCHRRGVQQQMKGKGCVRRSSRSEDQENNLNANNKMIPCTDIPPNVLGVRQATSRQREILGDVRASAMGSGMMEAMDDERHIYLHQQANQLFLAKVIRQCKNNLIDVCCIDAELH